LWRPGCPERDSDANDWSIREDGQEIGRLYEDPAATRPELTWFWSTIVIGKARRRVKTDERAATLEDAKAQFAANWEAFRWRAELASGHRSVTVTARVHCACGGLPELEE
jgi:hypothetical protein